MNEVYLDAADPLLRKAGLLEGISDDAATAMADRWNADSSVERQKILAKFKVALECVDKSMDLGREPAQSVKLLIDFRDSLRHYKPQWQGDNPEPLFAELHKRLLVNSRFSQCNPWFPHQALSADMAEWAWKTSLALAQQWWREMGLVRDPIPESAVVEASLMAKSGKQSKQQGTSLHRRRSATKTLFQVLLNWGRG